jgi:AAA domain
LLPRSGVVVIWGPPKCGKSFWATDLGLHIALAWEYRGRRVQQATVVYIALEGRHGFPARIEAFKRHHGAQSAPFHLITKPLDLVRKAEALIESIEAQLGDERPGVVFLDTLNRSLVGSESKDEDMAAYLGAAGKIEERFSCLVVIVHHCGIDATRPRGHTSLSGAVEVQIAVKRGGAGEVIATVELAKDMEEGAEIFSRLELVDLGTDPDSDRITSLVVQPAEATAKAERKVTGTKKVALDILRKAIDEAGVAPPASNHIPQNAGTTLIEPGAPMPTKEPSPIATSSTRENERLHALLKGSKQQI